MTTKQRILWTVVVIVILALGGVSGYLLGQTHKDQEVDLAKTSAKYEALEQVKADTQKTQAQAPAKPVIDTTCNADELSLTVKTGSDSGAGTLAYNLELTNTSKRTCTLGGFPGVSLVNDNGNQVGMPAERAKNYTEKKLTLAPNTKVKAVVSVANSSNFSDGQCKTGATKFRVYPPNDTGYLSVATTVDAWCPGFMISPVLGM